jgi:hypothetical protein
VLGFVNGFAACRPRPFKDAGCGQRKGAFAAKPSHATARHEHNAGRRRGRAGCRKPANFTVMSLNGWPVDANAFDARTAS